MIQLELDLSNRAKITFEVKPYEMHPDCWA